MQADLKGSIGERLKQARLALEHLDSARLDAELLLAHTLQVDRTWLIAHQHDPCSEDAARHYFDLVARRARHEPVAYLTSHKGFWDHDLFIERGVLVPRPETEQLVEIALTLDNGEAKVVLDLGTGSGCIALSLARAIPHWFICAVEIESSALQVAKRNLATCLNVNLIQASWLEGFKPAMVDLIVSNPPYIAAEDPHLDRLSHEPLSALVADNDGYGAFEAILAQASKTLKPSGALIFEHGFDQRERLTTLMQSSGFKVNEFDDLAGQPRALMGTLA